MNKSLFLQIALQAVSSAQKIINKYYQSGVRATLKQDQSPVTIADQEAEEAIKNIISTAFPDHAFLGEESGSTTTGSEYTWIIDPIDGTKHYLRQIPLFATQLALMRGDEIILGVSNAPAINELIWAEKGEGAFLNDKRITVSDVLKLDQAYLSYGGLGYFKRNNLLNNLINLEASTQGHRGIGDFWSYHLLAQGKIEIMVEAATKIWDIAAASIIVKEAGGKVTDLQGNPITKSSHSIIATNGLVHDKVVGYFR